MAANNNNILNLLLLLQQQDQQIQQLQQQLQQPPPPPQPLFGIGQGGLPGVGIPQGPPGNLPGGPGLGGLGAGAIPPPPPQNPPPPMHNLPQPPLQPQPPPPQPVPVGYPVPPLTPFQLALGRCGLSDNDRALFAHFSGVTDVGTFRTLECSSRAFSNLEQKFDRIPGASMTTVKWRMLHAFRAYLDYWDARQQDMNPNHFQDPDIDKWINRLSRLRDLATEPPSELRIEMLPPFTSPDHWIAWERQFTNYLCTLKNRRTGQDLTYLIRPTSVVDQAALTANYATIEADLLATAAHSGPAYEEDNKLLYNILYHVWDSTTPAWERFMSFTLANNQDGRAAWLAVSEHLGGPELRAAKIHILQGNMSNAKYTGANKYTIDDYNKAHLQSAAELARLGEPVSHFNRLEAYKLGILDSDLARRIQGYQDTKGIPDGELDRFCTIVAGWVQATKNQTANQNISQRRVAATTSSSNRTGKGKRRTKSDTPSKDKSRPGITANTTNKNLPKHLNLEDAQRSAYGALSKAHRASLKPNANGHYIHGGLYSDDEWKKLSESERKEVVELRRKFSTQAKSGKPPRVTAAVATGDRDAAAAPADDDPETPPVMQDQRFVNVGSVSTAPRFQFGRAGREGELPEGWGQPKPKSSWHSKPFTGGWGSQRPTTDGSGHKRKISESTTGGDDDGGGKPPAKKSPPPAATAVTDAQPPQAAVAPAPAPEPASAPAASNPAPDSETAQALLDVAEVKRILDAQTAELTGSPVPAPDAPTSPPASHSVTKSPRKRRAKAPEPTRRSDRNKK